MEHIFHGSLLGSASSIDLLPPRNKYRYIPLGYPLNYVHLNKLARYWFLPVAFAKM